MASMEIFQLKCDIGGCEASASRRVRNGDGMVVGEFCSRHGNAELIRVAQLEKPKAEKPVKAVKNA